MVNAHQGKSRDELIAQARQAHPGWAEDDLGPWANSKLQVSPQFANAPRAFPPSGPISASCCRRYGCRSC